MSIGSGVRRPEHTQAWMQCNSDCWIASAFTVGQERVSEILAPHLDLILIDQTLSGRMKLRDLKDIADLTKSTLARATRFVKQTQPSASEARSPLPLRFRLAIVQYLGIFDDLKVYMSGEVEKEALPPVLVQAMWFKNHFNATFDETKNRLSNIIDTVCGASSLIEKLPNAIIESIRQYRGNKSILAAFLLMYIVALGSEEQRSRFLLWLKGSSECSLLKDTAKS